MRNLIYKIGGDTVTTLKEAKKKEKETGIKFQTLLKKELELGGEKQRKKNRENYRYEKLKKHFQK